MSQTEPTLTRFEAEEFVSRNCCCRGVLCRSVRLARRKALLYIGYTVGCRTFINGPARKFWQKQCVMCVQEQERGPCFIYFTLHFSLRAGQIQSELEHSYAVQRRWCSCWALAPPPLPVEDYAWQGHPLP